MAFYRTQITITVICNTDDTPDEFNSYMSDIDLTDLEQHGYNGKYILETHVGPTEPLTGDVLEEARDYFNA